MAEVFKFHKKDKAYYNIEIDGEVLTLPLGSSMSMKTVKLIKSLASTAKKTQKMDGEDLLKAENSMEIFEILMKIFESAMPEDSYKKFDFESWAIEDLIALFNAWQTAAKQVQGMSLGGSQASASS